MMRGAVAWMLTTSAFLLISWFATPVNGEDGLYYQHTFWNDFEQVRAHMNTLATGDPQMEWWKHMRQVRGAAFERVLVINCGNGWVERDLLKAGIIKGALGIDYSADLLKISRKEAAAMNASSLTYKIHDINKDEVPQGPFDLILNVAAAHHISYIDRAFSQFRTALDSDGWFVSFDYVGPHRNQYPDVQWKMLHAVNQLLPPKLQQQLSYPHLPTMLANDPSEAVHSELFNATLRRHFDVAQWRSVGGSIAYPLITHNMNFFKQPLPVTEESLHKYLDMLLLVDWAWTESTGQTMFAYIIATPKKYVDKVENDVAQAAENKREAVAEQRGGVYYRPTRPAFRLYGSGE